MTRHTKRGRVLYSTIRNVDIQPSIHPSVLHFRALNLEAVDQYLKIMRRHWYA